MVGEDACTALLRETPSGLCGLTLGHDYPRDTCSDKAREAVGEGALGGEQAEKGPRGLPCLTAHSQVSPTRLVSRLSLASPDSGGPS